MNPTNSDRRRFLLATALTLCALPALWWVSSTTDSGAPKVASVDVALGDSSADPVAPSTTAPASAAPVFLDGPAAQAGAAPAPVAVPATPAVNTISTDATYRSSIYPTTTCLVGEVPTGRTITVVNLNNGRSVTCTSTRAYSAITNGLTMHTTLFSEIADLTDAPIPVEIRQ